MDSLFELANNDLLVCDWDTGKNNYDMNLQFADRLENISKTLAIFSKDCSTKATEVRDKVDTAKDGKDHLQDCFYVGDILQLSQMCKKLKKTSTGKSSPSTLAD